MLHSTSLITIHDASASSIYMGGSLKLLATNQRGYEISPGDEDIPIVHRRARLIAYESLIHLWFFPGPEFLHDTIENNEALKELS